MSTLRASRSSQNVQVAEFVASFSDSMADVTGTTKDMLSVTAGDVFKAIQLPPNVEIIGGNVQIETQGAGPTAYTLEVGTSSDGTAGNFSNKLSNAGTFDLKQVAGTKLDLTYTDTSVNPGLQSANPNDVYIRLIRSVAAATAGKFVLRVMFIQRGKADEAVPA
jgi:hypothetical protein